MCLLKSAVDTAKALGNQTTPGDDFHGMDLMVSLIGKHKHMFMLSKSFFVRCCPKALNNAPADRLQRYMAKRGREEKTRDAQFNDLLTDVYHFYAEREELLDKLTAFMADCVTLSEGEMAAREPGSTGLDLEEVWEFALTCAKVTSPVVKDYSVERLKAEIKGTMTQLQQEVTLNMDRIGGFLSTEKNTKGQLALYTTDVATNQHPFMRALTPSQSMGTHAPTKNLETYTPSKSMGGSMRRVERSLSMQSTHTGRAHTVLTTTPPAILPTPGNGGQQTGTRTRSRAERRALGSSCWNCGDDTHSCATCTLPWKARIEGVQYNNNGEPLS